MSIREAEILRQERLGVWPIQSVMLERRKLREISLSKDQDEAARLVTRYSRDVAVALRAARPARLPGLEIVDLRGSPGPEDRRTDPPPVDVRPLYRGGVPEEVRAWRLASIFIDTPADPRRSAATRRWLPCRNSADYHAVRLLKRELEGRRNSAPETRGLGMLFMKLGSPASARLRAVSSRAPSPWPRTLRAPVRKSLTTVRYCNSR